MLSVLLIATAAVAPPSAPVVAEADIVNEVVVTARRRDEKAQDVPIAISVVNGGTLDAVGAYNINRLQQLTPTLQF